MFDRVTVVIEGRREREFAPRRTRCAGSQTRPKPMPSAAMQARTGETLETMQMFDDWYRDVARLPRALHMCVHRLGARIARLLPKAKDR